MTTILSIQSSVAYGHVGNSVAVFAMQRLGVEVWPVHTVHFSNHTGYGDWRGPVMDPDDVRDILAGVAARGALDRVDAVVSGYLGSAAVGEVVLEAVCQVRAANPDAFYVCDPVMANATAGCFVGPEIPVLLRETVVPRADLVTPNQVELGRLTGSVPTDLTSTVAAVDRLRALGPGTVLVTSVLRPEAPSDTVEMLAADESGAWLVRTPLLPGRVSGSGDLTAAVFTTHLVGGRSVPEALTSTASSVFDVVAATVAGGHAELRLVQTQEAIAHPRRQFEAIPVR